MNIAVDQTKLRRIVDTILDSEDLNRNEAAIVLQITQLVAGSDEVERPAEHMMLQAIAQRVSSLVGIEPEEISAIPPITDDQARLAWFESLGAELHTRAARELAFTLAFLVTIADLEMVPAEHENLEELQHAIGVDDRRATDLVVQLTETLAPEEVRTNLAWS